MIKDVIKQMIINDILSCEEALKNKNGSENLYFELKTKYTTLDKNFDDNIDEENNKACAGSSEFDYRHELRQIKAKLEMYIKLNMIPLVYNENVSEGVNININAKILKNIGNIGNGNSQDKIKQIKIKVKKSKFNFWTMIFIPIIVTVIGGIIIWLITK